MASTSHFHGYTLPQKRGTYRVRLNLKPLLLASGSYSFDVFTEVVNVEFDHAVASAVEFDVQFSNPLGFPFDLKQSDGYGSMALLCDPAPEFLKMRGNNS
jgi:hypothetical protein